MSPRQPLERNSPTLRPGWTYHHAVPLPVSTGISLSRSARRATPIHHQSRSASARHRRGTAVATAARDSASSRPRTHQAEVSTSIPLNITHESSNTENPSCGNAAALVELPPTPEATPPATEEPLEHSSPALPSTPRPAAKTESAADQTTPESPSHPESWRSTNAETRGLLVATIIAVQSIFGTSAADASNVLPLGLYIKELLRRSRTTKSTLQAALFYLHKGRTEFRAIATGHHEQPPTTTGPSPPHLLAADGGPPLIPIPISTTHNTPNYSFDTSRIDLQPKGEDPARCGRRMLLAALIAASKNLEDRTWSNRAWSKISGLPIREINANELAFLRVLRHELFIPVPVFQQWTERLATITTDPESTGAVDQVAKLEPTQQAFAFGTSIPISSARLEPRVYAGLRGSRRGGPGGLRHSASAI